MAATIKAFALTPGGLAVAALSDGRIVEQQPKSGNTSGRFDCDFKTVEAAGLVGRVLQLACKYNGAIVALTAAGALYELDRTASGYAKEWRAIEPPVEPI
jgi:hypothetical protein